MQVTKKSKLRRINCRKMRTEKNKQNKDVRLMLYVTEAALLWCYDI